MVDILITGGTVITMDPGRRVLEDGAVKTVDESEVLEMAQREAEAAIDRNDLRHLLDYIEGYWGRSRY